MKIDKKITFLKRTIAGCFLAMVMSTFPTIALANVIYNFSGSNSGGTGSATMDVGIVGNVLTIKLDNTSPLQLDASTGTNTPGITGFGFNLADPLPSLSSWSLTAFKTDGTGLVTIGSTALGSSGSWVMNTTIAGVTLDFLPTTAPSGNGNSANIKGALYNPLATSGFGATPNYQTQAILTMTFLSAPVLAQDACGSGHSVSPTGQCDTFVRMQDVGSNGSLKLPGTPGTPPNPNDPPTVPEPGNLALLGLGLIACVFALRRSPLKA